MEGLNIVMEKVINEQTKTLGLHNEESNQSDASMDNSDKLNDSDGSIERLFEGSTHYYLIYVVDEDGNRSINLALLGLLIVIIQSVLYGILLDAGFGDDYLANDKVAVHTNIYDAYVSNNEQKVLPEMSATFGVDITSWPIVNNLECDSPDEALIEGEPTSIGNIYVILGMILVGCFLQYDYLASISVIINEPSKWSKLAGLIVFIEALLATFCCSLFAFQAIAEGGSAYDAIMNTVGVLFVHDVDEKLYEAVSIIDPNKLFKNCKWCNRNGNKCGYWTRNIKLWITLIVIICVVFIGAYLLPIIAFNPILQGVMQDAGEKWTETFQNKLLESMIDSDIDTDPGYSNFSTTSNL